MSKRTNYHKSNSCNCKVNLNLARTGAKHPAWKENPGYSALHLWVIKLRGKANTHKCHFCKIKQAEHWMNKDHSYLRVLEDYLPACAKCHAVHDKKLRDAKKLIN